jgi:hypothetical protein
MLGLRETTQGTRDWLSGNRRRLQRIALALAAFCFVVGLAWALRAFPESQRLDIWPLAALLFLCVPLIMLCNATEFLVMSRVAGVRMGWSASLETTVYASAANMLPLPGGVITRIAALKAGGATIRAGSMITALFVGIWGGTAFCYSGAWLAIAGHQALGGMFAAGGAGLMGLCAVAASRLHARISDLAIAFAIRLFSLLVEVLRHMLAIWALGAAIGFGEASIFAVSGFVGSAVSVVPAGLGVREFVVAALSPLIALPAAVGFLSAAVNRMVDMVGLAILSTILFFLRRDFR